MLEDRERQASSVSGFLAGRKFQAKANARHNDDRRFDGLESAPLAKHRFPPVKKTPSHRWSPAAGGQPAGSTRCPPHRRQRACRAIPSETRERKEISSCRPGAKPFAVPTRRGVL